MRGDVTAGMMGQQKTVQMRMNRVSVLSQAFQAARTAPAGVAAIVSILWFLSEGVCRRLERLAMVYPLTPLEWELN